MKKRMISFSPPDISKAEIAEVAEALRSGWITTGPRTKLLERRLAAYIETGKTDIDCIAEENNKKLRLSHFLGWCVQLGKHIPGVASYCIKAFGDSYYDPAISEYADIPYQLVPFRETVSKTEKI